MNTTEGNKLITQHIKIGKPEKKLLYDFMGYTVPDVISWNELMPVVEKIERKKWVVKIHLNSCFIVSEEEFINSKKRKRFSSYTNSKINSVYTAVIQFITWYNQQQKEAEKAAMETETDKAAAFYADSLAYVGDEKRYIIRTRDISGFIAGALWQPTCKPIRWRGLRSGYEPIASV